MTDEVGYALIAAVVLLIANGYFVAVEFALIKARPFRINQHVTEGKFGAKLTQRMQGDLEAYLAACQLGITMASLGLGWVGEPAVAALLEPAFVAMGVPDAVLHTVSFIIGFLIFSSLHIVVGEQVPKTFAIRQAEPVSMALAWPLQVFFIVMFPLNWTLNWASGSILGMFGVEEATHADVLTGEELQEIVSTSRDHGAIGEQKATMISNLFAFDTRTVGRVMIPRSDVIALDINDSPDDIRALVVDSQHSRFPVLDGVPSNIVGVLLAKDVFGDAIREGEVAWTRIRSYCRDPIVVPESVRISVLFDTMRQKRGHMAVVVDEYGDLAGIVTLEDLLEEIVGDLSDETDVEDRYAIAKAEGGWTAHGLTSLSDLEREVGTAFDPTLDANTLSGLFMVRLGRMPEVGDSVIESGFVLEVTEMHLHHVRKVKVLAVSSNATASAPAGDEPPDAGAESEQKEG